jgi:hypothetical protein
MSKKAITLSIALVGVLLLSTLFYSKAGKGLFSSFMDSSIEDTEE